MPIRIHQDTYNKAVEKRILEGNAQFMFLRKTQKSSLNVCLIKILKSTVTKKSNCVI